MKDKTNRHKIQQYFQNTSAEFDAIYSNETYLIMNILNRMFRRGMYERYQKTLKACGDVSGKRILDVGCGSGRFAIPLALAGAKVVGIDFAASMLEIAERLAKENSIESRCNFIQADFLDYDFPGDFDIVLAIGFFDYTKDAKSYLKKMHTLTTDKIIATFPRLWRLRTPFRKLRLAIGGCPVYFYTYNGVRNLLKETGFTKEVEMSMVVNNYFVVGHK